MNTMTYKGYTASVEFDGDDGILVGHVSGLRDLIDCEGTSVAELEMDFRHAIDSYLEACRKTGKKPDKPSSGKLLLRLPPEVHADLTHLAETTGRSANQLIVDAVRVACLGQAPDAHPPKPRGRRTRRTPIGTA